MQCLYLFLRPKMWLLIFNLCFLFFQFANGASPVAVSTFECIGLSWSPANGSASQECTVRYRKSGQANWRTGLPLWFDEDDSEYRGSIVHLTPNTNYEIELRLTGTTTVANITASTWTEDFPIAQTIHLPENLNTTLEIDQSGSPNGYILYIPHPGSTTTIDVNNNSDTCIKLKAGVSHIIIRNLTLRSAAKHAIRFYENTHDIVVEGCDISNWGQIDSDGWGVNHHSAFYSGDNTDIERIVIQRNRIHHPRSDANSWEEYRSPYSSYHPRGPQAVCFKESNGNHVIRYNDIYSDEDHYFNDALGGTENYSFKGFPNRDSDIYGNYIANAWDDGIESEGANRNVRIWGNYIDKTFAKIAAASTSKGPLYIWRNIANTSRRSAIDPNSDTYERGPFLKVGGQERNGVWYGSGRTYVFHNTVLQASPSAGSYPLGGDGGIEASGGDLYNVISRNNILTNHKPWRKTFRDRVNSCTNDFDYDLYNGKISNNCASRPHQSHGIDLGDNTYPAFDPANGPGEFALLPGAAGFNAGIPLSNFNDSYNGSAPDMGAFEASSLPMQFGASAYSVNASPMPPTGLQIGN